MLKFEYTQREIDTVSKFLQNHMLESGVKYLTADQAAELLAKNSILRNDKGPKPGFNFREMLRQGHDGKVARMKGVYQLRPGSRWKIILVDK